MQLQEDELPKKILRLLSGIVSSLSKPDIIFHFIELINFFFFFFLIVRAALDVRYFANVRIARISLGEKLVSVSSTYSTIANYYFAVYNFYV